MRYCSKIISEEENGIPTPQGWKAFLFKNKNKKSLLGWILVPMGESNKK